MTTGSAKEMESARWMCVYGSGVYKHTIRVYQRGRVCAQIGGAGTATVWHVMYTAEPAYAKCVEEGRAGTRHTSMGMNP